MKIGFVAFCRGTIKNEIRVFQDDPRKPLKYWIGICTLTYRNLLRNFGGMLIFNFLKFQIFLEQSIFVVQKRLIYEKASIAIVDGKYDEIKIERFS